MEFPAGRVFAAFCLVGTLVALPGAANGQKPQPVAREVVRKGAVEAGLLGGFYQATTLIGDADSDNRSAVYALPQIGLVLTDEFQAGDWSGNVTVLLEPLLAHYFEPFSASAFGGTLMFKYNFLAFGRWLPFWDAGGGALWTDLAPRIEEQSTEFNFVLQTGPGVQYFLTDRRAFTLGVRYHHISNAGTGSRNVGLNAVLVYLGLSFYFPD